MKFSQSIHCSSTSHLILNLQCLVLHSLRWTESRLKQHDLCRILEENSYCLLM